MGLRSKINHLPKTLREELDRRLLEQAFSGYRALESWLGARGHRIAKSTIQRYGSGFEHRVAAIKLATLQAKAVVDASPDDGAAMSDALTRLVQQRLFEVLAEADIEEPNLARLARAVADLGRSTIQHRRWTEEMKDRLERQKDDAGKKVDALRATGGLSDEAAEQIRSALLEINPLREKRATGRDS